MSSFSEATAVCTSVCFIFGSFAAASSIDWNIAYIASSPGIGGTVFKITGSSSKNFSGTIDDALVLDVIGTYKKQMEKAKQEFAAAGDRGKDQIAEIDFELAWCAKWLPQGMSEAELRDAVAKAVAELPAKDPKMAGRVIGAIKKQFGDRADAQLAKKIADELLSS